MKMTCAMLCAATGLLALAARGNAPVFAQAAPAFGDSGPVPVLGTVRLDARGGAGSASPDGTYSEDAGGHAGYGGNGGAVSLVAPAGLVQADDARLRPASLLGLNALAGALSDGVVTYSEIAALPWFDANLGLLDLPAGYGIAVPAGAVLNLADAPAPGSGGPAAMEIRVADDLVLLHGEIRSRNGAGQCHGFSVVSGTPVATAPVSVVFDGTADFSATKGEDGGYFALRGEGTVIATGAISARGGTGVAGYQAGAGGNGGAIELHSQRGDVLHSEGCADASGGNGYLAGGVGGLVAVSCAGSIAAEFSLGARVNGGNCGTGLPGAMAGDSGSVLVTFTGAARARAKLIARSGRYGDSFGGGATGLVLVEAEADLAGYVWIDVSAQAGALAGAGLARFRCEGAFDGSTLLVDANGAADGADYGGSGGSVQVLAQAAAGSLLHLDANAWGGSLGSNLGFIEVTGRSAAEPALFENSRLELSSAGYGTAAWGANGGEIRVGPHVNMTAVEVSAKVSGGAGSGYTGPGGTFHMLSEVQDGLVDGSFDVTNNGGGGQVRMEFAQASGTFRGTLNVIGAGTAGTASRPALDAASVFLSPDSDDAGGGAWEMAVALSLYGGIGRMDDPDGGRGGAGGAAHLHVPSGSTCAAPAFSVNLNGGASDYAYGGMGGNLLLTGGGDVSLGSGDVRFRGGRAFVVTYPDSNYGGAAGACDFNMDAGLLQLDCNLLGSALDAEEGEPSAGAPGRVTVALDHDEDGNAGSLVLNGNVTLRGARSEGIHGGVGGVFEVSDQGAAGGGNVSIAGMVNVTGGAAPQDLPVPTTGGAAGRISIDTAGQVSIEGSLLANGGAGTWGGTAAGNAMLLGNNRASVVVLGSAARVRANGGAGAIAAQNGAGGEVQLNPAGSGPANPNLVEFPGSVVSATGNPAGSIVRD